jgi:hypothetical protein
MIARASPPTYEMNVRLARRALRLASEERNGGDASRFPCEGAFRRSAGSSRLHVVGVEHCHIEIGDALAIGIGTGIDAQFGAAVAFLRQLDGVCVRRGAGGGQHEQADHWDDA